DPAPPGRPAAALADGPTAVGCAQPLVAAVRLGSLLCPAGDAAALASAAGRPPLGVPKRRPGPAAARPAGARADPPACPREPLRGLPGDRRRAPAPGDCHLGDRGTEVAEGRGAPAGAAALPHELADVPASACDDDVRLRLFTVETAWLRRLYVLAFLSLAT